MDRKTDLVTLFLVSVLWLSVNCRSNLLFVYQALHCIVYESFMTLLGLFGNVCGS